MALLQIHLFRADDLSPWKGGGFGMFSSTDAGRQRQLRVYLVEPGRAREVAIPESLEDRAMRAAALPSPSRLRDFAASMGAEVGGLAPQLVAVRVELWRTRFDPQDLLPSHALVRRIDLPWGGHGR